MPFSTTFQHPDPGTKAGKLKSAGKSLACFISPHGFGHAARMTAILESLSEIDADVHFHLFTTVPSWFFDDPLSGNFSYHSTVTDVGFVQSSPFLEDLEKTALSLDAFLPFNPDQLDGLSENLRRLNCRGVLCDIAPLGIAAAKRAGLFSVLIENFTWDWLYSGYAGFSQRVRRHIDYLASVFEMADHRIQTHPVCKPVNARLTLPPIFRKPRTDAGTVRGRLEIPRAQRMVLVSLGGIPDQVPFFPALKNIKGVQFVIPGGSEAMVRKDNVRLLPYRSEFYHPDLVNASDAVIGKAGYSTIAEVFGAGVPFGFIPRPDFPESRVLADFIEDRMCGHSISLDTFYTGAWISLIEPLLSSSGSCGKGENGASQAAHFLSDLLNP